MWGVSEDGKPTKERVLKKNVINPVQADTVRTF
jgi:hypothetical protein